MAASLALLLGAGFRVFGQSASVQLRATRHDTLVVDSSAVVTTAFVLQNRSRAPVDVTPTLRVPSGWRTLMGAQSFTIAPDSNEVWLASVAVPLAAQAGVYLLHATTDTLSASGEDIAVRVEARRALSVVAVDIPGWVTAGTQYTARFTVRNRGNVPATIVLSAATSRGVRCMLDATTLSLAPGASAPVTVRVPTTKESRRSVDDLVELSIADRADDHSRAVASIRTSVIPQVGGWDEDLTSMPGELTLRAAGTNAGVSPATLRGSGPVSEDGHTTMDFSISMPTRGVSPFGEIPVSYADLNGAGYRLRAGDALYGFSTLTSGGALGRGFSMDKTFGDLAVGAYSQEPVWHGYGPSQVGAIIGTGAGAPAQLSGIAVEQVNPGGERDRIYSGKTTLRLGDAAVVTAEQAASDSASGSSATQVRIGGTVDGVTYNGGYLHGGASFSGPSRGVDHRDVSLTTQHWNGLALIGSGSTQTLVNNSAVIAFRQSTTESRAGVELAGLATVEFDGLHEHDESGAVVNDGTQQAVRVNANVPFGRWVVSGTTEGGRAEGLTLAAPRDYFNVGASARVSFSSMSLSAFAQRNDGNSLGGPGRSATTGGTSAQIQLAPSLTFTATTTFSTVNVPLGVANPAGWYGQIDAHLEYKFTSGMVLSLRGHEWQHPELQGAPTPALVYLEVRNPLRLPTGFRHDPGRVQGRVVDAETGRPLSGTLVRLGDQAAITDNNGRVAFTGLEPASYRVAVDAMGKSSGALLVGNADVNVLKDVRQPAAFSVGVVRGARLKVAVREQAYASTVGVSADSLVDSGDAGGILVGLAGARDTVYQTADDKGRVDFGDVIPGSWTVFVATTDGNGGRSAPQELSLQPGDDRDLTLRLVPQRKTVTVVGEATELVATSAPVRSSASNVTQLAEHGVVLASNLPKVAVDSGKVALPPRRLESKKRGSEGPGVNRRSHGLESVGSVVDLVGVARANGVLQRVQATGSVTFEDPENWFIRILHACSRKIRAELVQVNAAIIGRLFGPRVLVDGHPPLDHGKQVRGSERLGEVVIHPHG